MLSIFIIGILIALLVMLGLHVLDLRARTHDAETDFRVQEARLNRQLTAKDTALTQIKADSAREQELDACLKQMERDVARERLRQQALIDVAYDLLLVVDDECQVQAMNDRARTIFAVEPGTLPQSLLDSTNVPELDMMVKDALINAEEDFEEQVFIGKAIYRVRARVYSSGDQRYIGLALHDVTQLVKLNRARRDMVANISHELRTPIANIRLTIDGLFHDQDKPRRKDSINSLRTIARETDNLLWLVQEMSDLAMIESGQAIVRLIDHSLFELVDESLERMKERAEAQHILLTRHIPEKLRVLCDRDLIQRVLVNLIHNGVKWSPQGETITVSAVDGDDEITVTVLDNGPGVPPEAVDRIFERFYQVDASRSGSEGTGLGLAICRHIVEAHGGRIWAESNADGGGGRFSFTLLSAGPGAEADSLPEGAAVPQDPPASDD